MALWSDRSKIESNRARITVIWKNLASHSQEICKTGLGENKEVLGVELQGISQALKITLKEITLKKSGRIMVYSDVQMAIKQLQKTKNKAG